MDTTPRRPDRTLLVLLAIVAAVVVIALAVVLSRGEPPRLDASTPSGTVQRYAEAVLAGDMTTAGTLMSQEALSNCDGYGSRNAENLRITLRGASESSNEAEVKVALVSTSGSGAFGVSEYTQEDRFSLIKVNDAWLVDSAPWQLSVCPGSGANS